ncbi:MAG TPA: hypothetical protein DDY88_01585, partial [Actinobacteria bacterium]|nr:hypothetical protein [Actinomycetota bacterium]
VLDEFGATVVHLASPLVLGRKVLKAARALHIPSVAIFQTHVSGFANHYRLGSASFLADSVIRQIHQHADLTLAPSRASEHYLQGLQVERIRIWGRGVDLEQFSPASHATPPISTCAEAKARNGSHRLHRQTGSREECRHPWRARGIGISGSAGGRRWAQPR